MQGPRARSAQGRGRGWERNDGFQTTAPSEPDPSAGTGTMVPRAWSEAPIDSAAGWGEGINQGGGGPGLGAGEVGESQNDPPKLEAFLTPPIEPVLAPKHK